MRHSAWVSRSFWSIASAAVLSLTFTCGAQTCAGPDPAEAISTDRPSFTNTSTTVPCRSLQFENGFNETSVAGERGWDLPQTLIRFGVTSRTELRFTAPDRSWNAQTGSVVATGAGDLALGVKQQLGPFAGFDVAAIGTLSLPTGSPALSSHGYDASVQLPWSHKLPAKLTAEGMFSVSWPTQSGQHNVTGLATALLDRQLTKALDGFAEYAGTFPGRGGPQHILDFGIVYKPTANQQVDLRGGLGLSAAAIDHFIGAGYSFRFNLRKGT